MEITKENQSICGIEPSSFHDGNISLFNYDFENKELRIHITDDYSSNKNYDLKFLNVFDFCVTHRESDSIDYSNRIFDWGEIPNDYCHDNYIETVKNKNLSIGGEWNEELFAVRFMFSDISYLYVICDKIVIEEC